MERRGIFVTGTHFFPNDSTVWRFHLQALLVETIMAFPAFPDDLPVHISLPHDPFLPNPRPPAILRISINHHEWQPQNGSVERAFIVSISRAVRAWLAATTMEYDATVATELLIDLTFGASTWSMEQIT